MILSPSWSIMIQLETFIVTSPWDQKEHFAPRPENVTSIRNPDKIKDIFKGKRVTFENVQGAVKISNGKDIVLDIKYWTDIAFFWSYFIDRLAEYLEQGRSIFNFPEQSLSVQFEKQAKGLCFTLKDEMNKKILSSSLFPEKEFISKSIIEAECFLDWLASYDNDDSIPHLKQLLRQMK